MRLRISCVLSLCAMAGLLLGLTGCGEPDKIGKTVPVSGKVAVDSKPLNTGVVTYLPDKDKGNKGEFSATGIISNGQYSLKTSNKEGAPPGWYKVIVSGMAPTGMGATTDMVQTGTGALPAAPVTIAPQYTSPLQTPLSIEVTASPKAGQYDLAVKSK